MHNPGIYKEIGINIIFPTTSVCDQGLTKKLPLEKKFSLSTDMRELLCIFRLPNA